MMADDLPQVANPKKRALSPSVQPLDDLVQKMNKATEEHEIGTIITTYSEFKDLASESDWQEEAEAYPEIQWDSQSLKNAVGSQLFFDAAINQPHQNLLRNALRPLLGFSSGEQTLEDSLEQAKGNVSAIITNHPYFRNRFTLYALASSYHLGHPIAHLVLAEGLRYLYNQEHDEEEEDTEDRFFSQSDQLLKLKLQNNRQQLRQFIAVDGIEAFTDLGVESLSDISQLEQKASLGLIHYDVLREIKRNPRLSVYCYDEETLKHVIDHFVEIGRQGDFEGYYHAALLIKGSIDNKKIYKTDAEVQKGYELDDYYLALSYVYGFHRASKRLSEEKIDHFRQQNGIHKHIFKELKKFVVPRKKKK